MGLTLRSRGCGKTIGNVGGAAEVDAQNGASIDIARSDNACHIEKVLSKLIVGVCYVLTTQRNACKGVKAVED